MTFFPRRWWAEMTTKEFRDLDPRTIAILPVAAVEQHGPHLPVMVDARINRGVHERIVELLPADLPVTVLPMLPVGKSIEHVNFPGTLTTTATTLQALWTDVGLSVARAGIQKLVILNSHGGQPQVLVPKAEFIHGIHGGSTETSIMMHLEPGLVNEAERADFASATIAMEAEYKHLHAEGFGVGFGWITEDLHPSGALGNALDADAARGKLLVDHSANGIIDLLKDMHAFTPPFALKKPGYLG
jgi:creatinine amidohydrolase